MTSTRQNDADATLGREAAPGRSDAPTEGGGAVVALGGVTRRFGEVTAVDEVSLTMARGETVALLGPNGAGKTTVVDILLGLTRPDEGTVALFGTLPREAIARGWVGSMLQDAGLPNGVRVGELVGLMRRLYPEPLPIEEVLGLTDLGAVGGQQVQRLSGGQRQRVRLACALVGQPELLVLDEPTAALDVQARQVFWERVHTYAAAGRTVVFATHRLDEADAAADRVVVLSNGRVVADGPPEEVKAATAALNTVSLAAGSISGLSRAELEGLPGVEAVEVGRGGRLKLHTTDADRTVRALLDAAPEVIGLEVTRAGMEEAFLSLTRREGS